MGPPEVESLGRVNPIGVAAEKMGAALRAATTTRFFVMNPTPSPSCAIHVPDQAGHRHSRTSGMSSPCSTMYCLCSISLSRTFCFT